VSLHKDQKPSRSMAFSGATAINGSCSDSTTGRGSPNKACIGHPMTRSEGGNEPTEEGPAYEDEDGEHGPKEKRAPLGEEGTSAPPEDEASALKGATQRDR
jgi:hypothetical protein